MLIRLVTMATVRCEGSEGKWLQWISSFFCHGNSDKRWIYSYLCTEPKTSQWGVSFECFQCPQHVLCGCCVKKPQLINAEKPASEKIWWWNPFKSDSVAQSTPSGHNAVSMHVSSNSPKGTLLTTKICASRSLNCSETYSYSCTSCLSPSLMYS